MVTHNGSSNLASKNKSFADRELSARSLSPEAIAEFRRLWKQKYNEELSEQEAVARANEFLGVMRLVLRVHSRIPRRPTPRAADTKAVGDGMAHSSSSNKM